MDLDQMQNLVTDLLTDLRHHCRNHDYGPDAEKVDFAQAVETSAARFWEEIDEAQGFTDPPRDTYTVTIAGTERHDGEKPWSYVVFATDLEAAIATAKNLHTRDTDDTDLEIIDRETFSGPPPASWNVNDHRTDTAA